MRKSMRLAARGILPLLLALAVILVPDVASATTWTDGTAQGWYKLVGTDYQSCTNGATMLCETAHPTSTDAWYSPSTHAWSDITAAPSVGATSGTITGYWSSSNGGYVVARKTSDNTLVRTTLNYSGTPAAGCRTTTAVAPPTGFPPTSFSWSLTCDTGYTLYAVDRVMTATTQEQRYVFGVAVTTCTTQLTDVSFSRISSGVFDERIKVNVAFYRVNVLHPAPSDTTSNLTGFFDSTYAVDGAPGYYFKGNTTDGSDSSAFRLVLKSDASTVVCVKDVTATDSGHINPAGSGSGASDPDTSADCGWNPFCYFKAALSWAFKPSPGLIQQWTTYLDTIRTHVPFSIIASGIQFITDTVGDFTSATADSFNDGNTPCNATVNPSSGLPGVTWNADNPLPDSPLCQAASLASSSIWWADAVKILKVMIWGGFFYAVWRRVGWSFGGKSKGTAD